MLEPIYEDYKDGIDCRERTVYAQLKIPNISKAPLLHRYKYYAREHLAAHLQISDLDKFLRYLNQNHSIYSSFNTIHLFNEFESIEEHYLRLRNKLSFISYYESLRDRIISHSKTLGDKKDETKALLHLYTAVASRLFAIKSHGNHVVVVDLLEYMKTIKKKMNKLQEMQKTEYIEEYRDEFKKSLGYKIKTATNLIHSTVIPAIDKIYSDVDQNIKELLKETFEKERATKEELKKAEENKRALQQQSMWHAFLAPFKVFASILSLAGPEGMFIEILMIFTNKQSFTSIYCVGMAAGAVIGVGVGVAENIVDGTTKTHTVSVPPGIYKNKILRVAEQAKSNVKLLKMKLEDLQKIFQNDDMSHFESILKQINETLIKVNDVLDSQEIPTIDVLNILKREHEALSETIDNAADSVADNPKHDRTSKRLSHAQSVIGIAGATLDLYETVRNDQKKLAEADQLMKELEDQLKVIKIHEQNIYNVMIPHAKMMEQSMNEAIKNAENKSHVVLDISKWTLQTALGDVKQLFNDMTQGFEFAGDLEHCIEKLNDGITTLIDVYDRIDSYSEKSKMVTLMTDIAIGSNEIQDQVLRNAVSKIEKIINTNFAIEQYEVALGAIKQHKFPFAKQYLDQFMLSTDWNTTDTAFTINVLKRIDKLVDGIRESNAVIKDIGSYNFPDSAFDGDAPFFKWDSLNYNEEIAQLLNGDDVTFVADIHDSGLKKNAIKFNEIWLKFRLQNQTMQNEFDVEIRKFLIRMEMIGNSFYRCDKRIYYISLEKPFDIVNSLKCMPPCQLNENYVKLKTSDAFLSPYTTWKIMLIPENEEYDYEILSHLQNYVTEIALEGRGHYLHNDASFEIDICNEHLDKYYRLDSIEHILNK